MELLETILKIQKWNLNGKFFLYINTAKIEHQVDYKYLSQILNLMYDNTDDGLYYLSEYEIHTLLNKIFKKIKLMAFT